MNRRALCGVSVKLGIELLVDSAYFCKQLVYFVTAGFDWLCCRVILIQQWDLDTFGNGNCIGIAAKLRHNEPPLKWKIPGLATGADGTAELILLIHQAALSGVIHVGLITLRAPENPGE